MTDFVKEFNDATIALKQQDPRARGFNKGVETVNLVAMFGRFGIDLTKGPNEF